MDINLLPNYVNPASPFRIRDLGIAIQKNKEAVEILKSITDKEKKELKMKFVKFSPENITSNINPFYIKCMNAFEFISSYVFVDISQELIKKISKLRDELSDLNYLHDLFLRSSGASIVQHYFLIQSICNPYSESIHLLVSLYDACYSKEETLDNFSLNDLNLEDDKKEIVLFDKDNPVVKE